MSGPGMVHNWGGPEQFNLSPGELQLVQERARRRMQMKAEYQRLLYNPYKNMSGDGGQPFDPLFQRFASTRADYYHYFKPNRWNFALFVGSWVVPVAVIAFICTRMQRNFDNRCRRAEIPWRYRNRKFE